MANPRDFGVVVCAAVSLVLPVGAWSAPAPEPVSPDVEDQGQEQPDCDTSVSLDEANLVTARHLALRAEALFNEGDYLGAIKAWDQVLVLMPDQEAALRVQRAHAYQGAFEIDGDDKHLRSARALFAEQLAGLAVDDPVRGELEAVVGELDVMITEIDDARARWKEAEEEAEREERLRRDRELLAESKARNYRTIQKVYYGVGGPFAGLGVGSLTAMGVFLARGAQTEREGQQTADMIGVPDGRYQELLAQGRVQNRAAVATGVVGGVFALTGVSLLTTALVRRWRWAVRKDDNENVVVRPMVGGVRGRF